MFNMLFYVTHTDCIRTAHGACVKQALGLTFFSLLFKQMFLELLNVKPNTHKYIVSQSLTVST